MDTRQTPDGYLNDRVLYDINYSPIIPYSTKKLCYVYNSIHILFNFIFFIFTPRVGP